MIRILLALLVIILVTYFSSSSNVFNPQGYGEAQLKKSADTQTEEITKQVEEAKRLTQQEMDEVTD